MPKDFDFEPELFDSTPEDSDLADYLAAANGQDD